MVLANAHKSLYVIEVLHHNLIICVVMQSDSKWDFTVYFLRKTTIFLFRLINMRPSLVSCLLHTGVALWRVSRLQSLRATYEQLSRQSQSSVFLIAPVSSAAPPTSCVDDVSQLRITCCRVSEKAPPLQTSCVVCNNVYAPYLVCGYGDNPG